MISEVVALKIVPVLTGRPREAHTTDVAALYFQTLAAGRSFFYLRQRRWCPTKAQQDNIKCPY